MQTYDVNVHTSWEEGRIDTMRVEAGSEQEAREKALAIVEDGDPGSAPEHVRSEKATKAYGAESRVVSCEPAEAAYETAEA